MQQVFDSRTDGEGGVIIVTTDFNEEGDREIIYNRVPMERAKQIYRQLGESIGATRFEMPTESQLINLSILFNDGKLEPEPLSNMVAMCEFILNRLHENGDVSIRSSKEPKK